MQNGGVYMDDHYMGSSNALILEEAIHVLL